MKEEMDNVYDKVIIDNFYKFNDAMVVNLTERGALIDKINGMLQQMDVRELIFVSDSLKRMMELKEAKREVIIP